MYIIAGFRTISGEGMKARSAAPRSGRERISSNRKLAAMVAMRVMTSASTSRKPRFCSSSTSSTSKPVSSTPTASGMWNRSWSAMADPMTSARSHAAIAISQMTQWNSTTGRE